MKKALYMAAVLALLYPSVLSALENKVTTNAVRAEVIADEAEIFLEASQHSIVIDTIPRGTTVTLFSSGKKNKKWLYISYLSEKRGAKVTGFIDKNRVEILKENPPEEPASPQEDPVEQLPEEKIPVSEEKTTREMEKELELRNFLKHIEKENQEMQAQQEQIQEEEDKKPQDVLEQERKAEEREILNEVEETQEIKIQETTEAVEKEPAEPKEAAKKVLPDETDDSTKLPEEETQEEEAAPTEEVQVADIEETESRNATKEEEEENKTQMQEGTTSLEQAFPAEKEALKEEGGTSEMERVIEPIEMPKVLMKVSVSVSRANIRLMPTTKSPIIHQVRSSTELDHLARTGNWYRVNLAPNKDGIVLSGYIHKNIVDEIYEAIPPPPIPEKIFDPLPEDE